MGSPSIKVIKEPSVLSPLNSQHQPHGRYSSGDLNWFIPGREGGILRFWNYKHYKSSDIIGPCKRKSDNPSERDFNYSSSSIPVARCLFSHAIWCRGAGVKALWGLSISKHHRPVPAGMCWWQAPGSFLGWLQSASGAKGGSQCRKTGCWPTSCSCRCRQLWQCCVPVCIPA